MRLRDLKISTWLTLGFGVLLLAVLAIGLFGLWQTRATNAAIGTIYADRMVPLQQLKTISDMLAVNIVDNTNKVAVGMKTPAQGLPAVLEAERQIAAQWQAYTGTYLVPEEKELVARIDPMLAQAGAITKKLRGYLEADRADGAGAMMSEVYRVIDPITVELDKLVALQVREGKAEYDASMRRYESAVRWFALVGLAALAAGIATAWWTIRAVTVPLRQALAVSRAVAGGDLTHPIAVDSGNEFGQLLAALKEMQDGLARVVSGVRQNAESVATASSQISQGNTDLSSRTEEQATALQQTAASMTQLAATVRTNAGDAQQGDELARAASDVATRGGAVVREVVDTMKGINDSSRRIADIIGVIDGIAFQTNILALNAAVEAARAGEQGRGFAVVAGEVRTLAQRSADAAKEIKDLITASVGQVEQGSALVHRAGATMGEVVEAIQRVTEIMGRISTASHEQNASVGQIGQAVQQMDQTTQQNAALVEESAAAAQSLKAQARQLVEGVAVFRTAVTA